ncbi:transcriptional regulator [Amycolatopsis acidiphila]|uniref:Helix-turn-helix domain-containing protein n=1 Tax=Amycolatopsis acidiphila TaxID=715473 RepID=A0A557ZMD0_9PSEU|nr:transcriptional regulator [Amycolatopsis acidiphila]TVT13160.1 helix-turn-helix domain-containing protein [Amycolatopsis acidiphila]UIJ63441.1 transcriptional regulator [Amycolatopsis acidiphila]GHG99734.1 hypothetical protein GCM10017788_80320 [Amycolatopsis acidiphila]
MAEQEPESGLREVVHQRVRLGVLAVLDRRGPCTFSQLRDALGQSDGGLSRHLGVLEQHGYITQEKVFENRRPRTWIQLSAAGAEAFREEQELLTKLLATASSEAGTDRAEDSTAAMTIVFAALLAETDAGTGQDTKGDEGGDDTIDRSTLVPDVPVLTGWRAEPIASGPVSARYDFPDAYTGFAEQREQRLMFMSHGLRGGWTATWHIVSPGQDDLRQDMAHAIVLELAGAADCASILAVMGPSTLDLPGVPGARGYLLPANGDGAPATAVAWFSVEHYLVSIVVTAAADVAVPVLEGLVSEVHVPLSTRQS